MRLWARRLPPALALAVATVLSSLGAARADAASRQSLARSNTSAATAEVKESRAALADRRLRRSTVERGFAAKRRRLALAAQRAAAPDERQPPSKGQPKESGSGENSGSHEEGGAVGQASLEAPDAESPATSLQKADHRMNPPIFNALDDVVSSSNSSNSSSGGSRSSGINEAVDTAMQPPSLGDTQIPPVALDGHASNQQHQATDSELPFGDFAQSFTPYFDVDRRQGTSLLEAPVRRNRIRRRTGPRPMEGTGQAGLIDQLPEGFGGSAMALAQQESFAAGSSAVGVPFVEDMSLLHSWAPPSPGPEGDLPAALSAPSRHDIGAAAGWIEGAGEAKDAPTGDGVPGRPREPAQGYLHYAVDPKQVLAAVHAISVLSLNSSTSGTKAPHRGNMLLLERLGNHSSPNGVMRESSLSITFSLLCMFFALPCLWISERTLAADASLRSSAEVGCIQVDADTVDDDTDGCLVHVKGTLCAETAVFDSRFPMVSFANGCVKLRTTCEMYRWIETSQSCEEVHEGQVVKVEYYRYHTDWCKSFESNVRFQDPLGHSNGSKPNLTLGTITEVCGTVTLGQFIVPPTMLDTINAFEDTSELIGDSVTITPDSGGHGSLTFVLEPSGYYVWRNRRPSTTATNEAPERDKVGDLRLKFEDVRDCPATVLALQCQACGQPTFVPYRPVRRRLCGWSRRVRKAALLEEADKTYRQIAEELMCCTAGLLGCLCCCFNCLVHCITPSLVGNEIFYICEGHEEMQRSLAEALPPKMPDRLWLFRGWGWLLSWLAGCAFFTPRWAILVCTPAAMAILVTCLFWASVASVANLIYQPSTGFTMLLCVAIVAAVSLKIVLVL